MKLDELAKTAIQEARKHHETSKRMLKAGDYSGSRSALVASIVSANTSELASAMACDLRELIDKLFAPPSCDNDNPPPPDPE